MKQELMPLYSSQSSFYGKAHIELVEKEDCDEFSLYSYDTWIMTISKFKDKGGYYLLQKTDNADHFTFTTMKHVKEFMLQLEVKPLEKRHLVNLKK